MRRLPPSRVSQCIRKGVFGRVSLIGAICVRRGKEDWRANRRGPLAGIFEGWREIRGSNSISSIPRSPIVRSFRPTKKRGFDCIAASVVELGAKVARRASLCAKWFQLARIIGRNAHPVPLPVQEKGFEESENVWLRFMFDRSNWISLLVCLQRIRRVA